MENKTNNVFETMTDMQKQAMESIASATEQMQKNLFSNNTLDTELFKKWYESQMAFFNQNNNTKGNPMEFFNMWMTSQMNNAKSWFDGNKMFNNMNLDGDMKKNYDNMMNMFNNWSSTMNNSYSEMLKNFNEGNGKDAFTGMFNNAEMYLKSFELWMPMFKSIQDKTFTPDTFKQMFNSELFKGMMDKMFNLQPDFMKNMTDESKANMFKMFDSNREMYNNMKNMMPAGMPDMSSWMSKGMESYNDMYSKLNSSLAPLMKLMPDGTNKQGFESMHEISNELNVFSVKSSQIQYVIYTTGMKAMEEVADSIYNKLKNGEEITSFVTLYHEWLNTNDKNFVKLFESEEYSKLQAELNAFGMRLKKNIDLQMEKAFANLPLINRTEMDELYKSVHEMKKRISMLEKQIDSDVLEQLTEAKPAAKKAAAKN